MNKLRRKAIYNIINKLEQLLPTISDDNDQNYVNTIVNLIELIQYVYSEEEMCKDNIPENLQSGDKYENSENACENLDTAIVILEDIDHETEIEDVIDAIIETIECLNDASI